ncbi:hypothetical protein [Variovorax terrae]|uniref:Uncharacterized protein n=1 Tax=Variovorax terrae TaxID=2923278 RepID=A0A9X1VXP3_9BURK|nr:hypothetical protein [Variovorax terrae]MCJ0765327.1 hypothetical protein [Variovorax terrae]
MKLQARLLVTGMKKSKGVLENGQPYDSTKVYAMTELDDSKGNGMGSATVEYALGTSEEFDKMKHLAASFPIECDAEIEIVTNGKVQKTVIAALRPVARAQQTKG